jgi:hypothetical protein
MTEPERPTAEDEASAGGMTGRETYKVVSDTVTAEGGAGSVCTVLRYFLPAV